MQQPTNFLIPVQSTASARSRWGYPYPRWTNVMRKFSQGAGSAYLVFTGAESVTHTAGAAERAAPDLTSAEGILQSLFSGQLSGPLAILGAIFLFLSAGQSLARVFGLVIGGAIIMAHLQGFTLNDGWTFLQHFGQRLAAAYNAFFSVDLSPANENIH